MLVFKHEGEGRTTADSNDDPQDAICLQLGRSGGMGETGSTSPLLLVQNCVTGAGTFCSANSALQLLLCRRLI